MKILAFGKNCGSFTNDQGEVVEYYKLSGVKFVAQVDDGVNKLVGAECGKFSMTKDAFNDLPDDAESYENGLMLQCDFDDKKKIIGVDVA